MSYPNEESLLLSAGAEPGVPAESQHAKTSGGPGHPRVFCEVQQAKERRENGLDNTLSETFPCSDPLSSIPNPSSHVF